MLIIPQRNRTQSGLTPQNRPEFQLLPLPRRRGPLREKLAYLLVGLLVLLLLIWAVLSYYFIIPRPQWVNLGKASQFSVARPTRVAYDTVNVWVVNTGEEFVVLHAVPNDISRCRIDWDNERQRFADVCRGTMYTNIGVYMDGPPPQRGLDRYPVRIDAWGDLYMEVSKPILGLSLNQ